MTKFLLTIVGVAIMAGLSACNTVGGVGQDVSNVGRDISAGAQGVEREIRDN
ncbi:MAG: hypothetical protein RIQ71_2245 [Verrucomicrobiota bacterium]|jgi:predicted small secreted protein